MLRRKAFTLMELLISIVLLGLIFNYLFSVINSVKKRNEPYVKITKEIQEDTKIYKLLYMDFVGNIGGISIISHKHFDVVAFQSNHSLYSLKSPYVYYFVSKDNKSLVRIESSKYFDILKERNPSKIRYYGDVVAVDMKSFKAQRRGGIFILLVRCKGHKEMVLSIPIAGVIK